MISSKVYCLISVCSCFVIILKFVFLVPLQIASVNKCGYGMEGVCFTDVVLHSLTNYHQETATVARRLPKTSHPLVAL